MIKLIIEAAKKEKIELTLHAIIRLSERKISKQDIILAITHYEDFVYIKESSKYNIYGPYSENLNLMISCVYKGGVIVITAHKVSKKRMVKK